MNIFPILIQGALLVCIMYALARHEADYSFPKVLLLMVILTAGGGLLAVPLGPLVIPVIFGGMIWALHQFFYLRWSKAALITVIYIVVSMVINFTLGAIVNA